MPTKLQSSDNKTIVIAILVAAASLTLAIKYFSRAFPEAAIEFRVNRDDSAPVAQKFLAGRGFNLDGYRHAAKFDYNDGEKVYLERTQGLERMNGLTRGPIHLWRWSHRWFKPQQQEEFRADVTPAGEVVGFNHEIAEAAAGSSLDQAAARTIAETFLTQVMQRNLADLEFVETETEKRPARIDHDFTWKQKSVELGDGSLRVEVLVDGDQVAGYREFVKVPEQWTRDYEKLRSRNDAAQVVDEVFWILLSVAMLVILIRRLRDRDVPVWMALAFGGVAAALYFLGELNSFSLAQFGYLTTDSYTSFIAKSLGGALLEAVGTGAAIFLLVAASEPMYRESYPNQISLRRYFTWQGLRSHSFFIANVVGITLTFFFFAYQTVFYLAANKMGAWAPADLPFTDLLNTKFPWITVLFIGFFPAVSEELQFRAFSIPFLTKLLSGAGKLLRSVSWLAIVLSAFIWGFLHAAYPNQPFFIRGLEVGMGGVVIGVIMLRYGIMATLIWHYSVDALYTAFLLIRSPNHYLAISGAAAAGIMLIPLAVAGLAYWRTGAFSDSEVLTNAHEGIRRAAREEVAGTEATLVYHPLSPTRLTVAGVLTLACVLLALIPVYRFGQGFSLRITRNQAASAADTYLRQQHLDPSRYRHAAWVHDNIDPLALRYLLEHKSLKESDQIYRQATRLAVYEVRYFRYLEKEEFHVFLDPTTGQVFGYRRLLDDDAPGASLSPERAQALAAAYVEQQGYHLSDFDLQSSEAVKRKAREDYTLVWQAKAGDPRNVAGAYYRLAVDVAGDEVVGLSHLFKLPEAWEREQSSTKLVNILLSTVGILVGLGLVGAGVVLLVLRIRSGNIPWRAAVKIGALIFVLMAVSELAEWSQLDRQYRTTLSLAAWRLFEVVSMIVLPLLGGLLCWLLVGLAASLCPEAWQLFKGNTRRLWRRDAAVCIVLALAARAGLAKLVAVFASRFHSFAAVDTDLLPEVFNASYPGLSSFLGGLESSVFYLCGLGIVFYVIRLGWKRRQWWLWAGIALLLVRLGPADAHSFPEFFVSWVMNFIPLVVAVALVFWFFRDNILAYLGVIFCLQVAQPLISLFSQPVSFYRWNGLLLAGLAILVLAWMFLGGREGEVRSEP
ncbi:MAG: lysostaphin resistance A-like protein [Terriglobia bacterium]|jgi:membrane protease YdiL (CAAX protease family)